jgi:hypothetical protein
VERFFAGHDPTGDDRGLATLPSAADLEMKDVRVRSLPAGKGAVEIGAALSMDQRCSGVGALSGLDFWRRTIESVRVLRGLKAASVQVPRRSNRTACLVAWRFAVIFHSGTGAERSSIISAMRTRPSRIRSLAKSAAYRTGALAAARAQH